MFLRGLIADHALFDLCSFIFADEHILHVTAVPLKAEFVLDLLGNLDKQLQDEQDLVHGRDAVCLNRFQKCVFVLLKPLVRYAVTLQYQLDDEETAEDIGRFLRVVLLQELNINLLKLLLGSTEKVAILVQDPVSHALHPEVKLGLPRYFAQAQLRGKQRALVAAFKLETAAPCLRRIEVDSFLETVFSWGPARKSQGLRVPLVFRGCT